MDKNTLPKYLAFIKHQLDDQEKVFQLLLRAETQVELILDKDLQTYPASKLHDCLLTLCDLIQQAKELSEALRDATLLLETAPD